MFSEITALAGRDGYAYAKNKYFAELYGVDERTIRRWIAKLADMKYVSVSMVIKANGADDFRRIVPLLDTDKNVLPPGQKCPPPYIRKNILKRIIVIWGGLHRQPSKRFKFTA